MTNLGTRRSTPSAWGTLQYGPSSGPGILIPNYELGVIIPIRGDSMEDVERQATALASFRRPLVKVRRPLDTKAELERFTYFVYFYSTRPRTSRGSKMSTSKANENTPRARIPLHVQPTHRIDGMTS